MEADREPWTDCKSSFEVLSEFGGMYMHVLVYELGACCLALLRVQGSVCEGHEPGGEHATSECDTPLGHVMRTTIWIYV